MNIASGAIVTSMTTLTELRRFRESGNPATIARRHWVPAFAGTTESLCNVLLSLGQINRTRMQ
jgi:hypothetical protein